MRDEVRLFWKTAVPLTVVTLTCGIATCWQVDDGNSIRRNIAEKASICRGRTEQGDAIAQYELGSRYYHGQGVPQDYAEALCWYRKSAEQGDSKAEYAIGYMYYHGQAVSQNYAEALRWYRQAAEQGDPKAQYELGYIYYQGNAVTQDYAEAVRWYRKAAEQGDAMAQDGLGLAYSQGKGVPQDYFEAVRWCRKAAEQGYATAQYDLGRMYYSGKGVPQDYAEAARWFRMAADQGDARARYVLGLKTHPGTMSKVYLSIAVLGGTLLLIDSLLLGRRTRNRQRRATALTGILGLCWVGLNLYGFSRVGTLETGLLVDAFYFAKSFLAGTFGAMLIFLIWRQSAKIPVGMAGTLLIGFNIYGVAHYDLRRLTPAIRAFYSGNGFLIGMTIVLAIALWLPTKKDQRNSESR